MKKILVIFGKKNTSLEIRELIDHKLTDFADYEIYNIEYNSDFINQMKWENYINDTNYSFSYIIGFTDYNLRKDCQNHLKSITSFKPVSIIHPSANIASNATIGKGCYIAAHTTVSINAIINSHVIINLNATVGHDSVIESHCVLLPGSRISGNVEIGEGSMIGSNAFIYQGVKIGRENIIDALTPIHSDVAPRMISASRNLKTFKRI